MRLVITENQFKNIISEQVDKNKINQIINIVKRKWNNDQLNRAIGWWNNWTMNNIVIDRYSKNYNISRNETLRIMNQYREGLKGLKIFYVFQDNYNAIAFVNPGDPKTVYVNVAKTKSFDPYLTFLHELQHLLYYIKPLHPEQKIGDDLNIEPSKPTSVFSNFMKSISDNLFGRIPESGFSYMYGRKMKLLGLNPGVKAFYSQKLKEFYAEKGDYTSNNNEILSRLKTVKVMLKKQPYDNMTIKEIGDLNNHQYPNIDPNLFYMTLGLLYSNNDMNYVVNQWNQYAKNDNTVVPPSNQV
jgi:hypothetical protein